MGARGLALALMLAATLASTVNGDVDGLATILRDKGQVGALWERRGLFEQPFERWVEPDAYCGLHAAWRAAMAASSDTTLALPMAVGGRPLWIRVLYGSSGSRSCLRNALRSFQSASV